MLSWLVLQETEDDMLIAAICELLPSFVKSMGPSAYASSTFAEDHWKELITCMKASKPSGIRAAAMGEPCILQCLYRSE